MMPTPILPVVAGLGMAQSQPAPLSVAPGYDHQPMFSPDGTRVLVVAEPRK